MELIQKYLTNNPCYKAGAKINVKGLMLHSVGCPQPNALVFVNNWNSSSYDSACVHGFIDANDGKVYQTLPWNHRGWHGGGSCNDTHIGVEMCEPSAIKYTGGANFTWTNKSDAIAAVKRTYNSAVELFAYLCKMYGLNPTASGVIVSHHEGYLRGIATNHGDPEHLWKGLGLPYTMDGFRKDVKAKMGGTSSSTTTNTSSTKFPATPFSVQVLVPDLNYRSQPSFSGTAKGVTGKGTFTITEVKNGWGKLKSGIGWIYLEEPTYVKIGASTSGTSTSTTPSSYKVKVTVDALNIRKGPGTNYQTNGCIRDKGVYTIIQTQNGWGYLKSKAGWIALEYTTRV